MNLKKVKNYLVMYWSKTSKQTKSNRKVMLLVSWCIHVLWQFWPHNTICKKPKSQWTVPLNMKTNIEDSKVFKENKLKRAHLQCAGNIILKNYRIQWFSFKNISWGYNCKLPEIKKNESNFLWIYRIKQKEKGQWM